MVWSVNKQNFKMQLGKLRIERFTYIKCNNREMAQQYENLINKTEKFLKNLEELNSFYDNDESIDAVLTAAVSYLNAFDQLNLDKKSKDALSSEELEIHKNAILQAYQTLTANSQQLVKKIESPEENMYAIHGQSRIRCNAFTVGVGVAAAASGIAFILAATIVSAPVITPLLAFGIVALILGSVLAITYARSLKGYESIASGTPLDEITQFVTYLDSGESPFGNKRIRFEENLIEDNPGYKAPGYV